MASSATLTIIKKLCIVYTVYNIMWSVGKIMLDR